MVWQGGAIDVSAAEAAAGALAEAAAGSVLEANGEELVVARLRGLPCRSTRSRYGVEP